MRIYLPATTIDLADDAGLSGRRAHACTQAVAAAHTDLEEGEFHALLAAAAGSLELVGRGSAGSRHAVGIDDSPRSTLHPLRVVVAADVDDAGIVAGGEPPSAVQAPPVNWSQVASFHVDDPDDDDGRELLRRAVAGDAGAAAGVAQLDLLWYDVTEREHLLRLC